MKIFRFYLIPLALVLVLTHGAVAQDHGHGDDHGKQEATGKTLADEPESGGPGALSPEKKVLLDNLMAEHRKKMEPLHKKLHARLLMVEALLLDDTMDDKKIEAAVNAVNEMQSLVYREGILLKKALIANDLPYFGHGSRMSCMMGMEKHPMGMMQKGGMMKKGMKCPMMQQHSAEK